MDVREVEGKDGVSGVGRRDFLRGVALGTAAIAGAGLLSACSKGSAAATAQTWDEEADVIVVGAGTGMQAAGYAKEKNPNLKVLLVDAGEQVGGVTINTGGSLCGAGTKMQQRFGIKDTADNFYKFLQHSNTIDFEKARILADRSAEVCDWTEDYLGHKFETVILLGGEQWPEAAKRSGSHQGRGKDLVERLKKYCDKVGVEYSLSTKLTKIIAEGSEVRGIVVKRGDKEVRIKAKYGVILATGYYGGSKKLMEYYSPLSPKTILNFAPPTDDGSAMVAAMYVGAQTGNFQNNAAAGGFACLSPEKLVPLNYVYSTLKGSRITVVVNKFGKRYGNETHADFTEATSTQPDGKGWVIVDESRRLKDKGYYAAWPGCSDTFEAEIKNGHILKADDIAGLAKATGLPEPALVETMNRYNADAKAGKDTEFGKTVGLAPVDVAPFYAIPVLCSFTFLHGGIVTNKDALVVGLDGNPFSRLYAVGTAATREYPMEYLTCGMCITLGFVFGRVAVEHVLKQSAWDASAKA